MHHFAKLTLTVALTAMGVAPLSTSAAQAQDHVHHARHNMLLFGTSDVFASHIVYKVPHNYQVIMRVQLPSDVLASYLAARAKNPDDTFIFLLDPMDIATIETAEPISGTLFHRDAAGNRTVLKDGVRLSQGDVSVLFFDELPTNLEVDPPPHS